ncbi:MAG: DUF711 family protein [Chloroflexota bacterium]
MKVRAVTVGAPVSWPMATGVIERAGSVAGRVTAALGDAGYEVQTIRLATPVLDRLVKTGAEAVALAGELDGAAPDAGFGYTSLGAADVFAAPGTALLEVMPEIIAGTETVFCSASVASREQGISLAGARACGDLVAKVAIQSADGFGNLRFAALANCPPHIPFFPAAYHDGAERLTVGLALEAADVAVEAFGGALTLDDARDRLVRMLRMKVRNVEAAARSALQGEPGAKVTGVDLSLAPFPADDRSIAHAFERLGVPAFGAHGTLFLASFLTDCLRAVNSERFGFSGLMLPVLEDSVLARRAAEGTFGVDSLLLYSAVCGLGLDTVPLPGDTTPAELAGVILDMAALAVKLDKPLTARLFPVPGKRAGDDVSWDFAFFSPSRVLPMRGMAPGGILAESETYNPAHRELPGGQVHDAGR